MTNSLYAYITLLLSLSISVFINKIQIIIVLGRAETIIETLTSINLLVNKKQDEGEKY